MRVSISALQCAHGSSRENINTHVHMCDAEDLCDMSIVIFNGVIPYYFITDLPLRTIKCYCVVFRITLRLLVIRDVKASRPMASRPKF